MKNFSSKLPSFKTSPNAPPTWGHVLRQIKLWRNVFFFLSIYPTRINSKILSLIISESTIVLKTDWMKLQRWENSRASIWHINAFSLRMSLVIGHMNRFCVSRGELVVVGTDSKHTWNMPIWRYTWQSTKSAGHWHFFQEYLKTSNQLSERLYSKLKT